jgi:hypothetical protein
MIIKEIDDLKISIAKLETEVKEGRVLSWRNEADVSSARCLVDLVLHDQKKEEK